MSVIFLAKVVLWSGGAFLTLVFWVVCIGALFSILTGTDKTNEAGNAAFLGIPFAAAMTAGLLYLLHVMFGLA